MYNFSFFNPVHTYVGRGISEQINTYCSGQHILLLSDRIVSDTPQYQKLRNLLGDHVSMEYLDILPNPESDMIDRIVQTIQGVSIDCVMAIGGGSTIDSAKVVAAIFDQDQNTEAYLKGAPIPARKLPLILIPTTAGTGSEVTDVSVITHSTTHDKVALVTPLLYGNIAVVDPEFTATVPPAVTASTGFDALCHAVEAYWSTHSTPPSDVLAVGAIQRILKYLADACQGNAEAREEMCIASYLAGMAFNQTRTNVCHVIANYLTKHHQVPHGAACAVTLVPFLRFNLSAVEDKLAAVARLCGYGGPEAFIQAVDVLYHQVGLKSCLSDYGVTSDEIPAILSFTIPNTSSKMNPIPLTEQPLEEVLRNIL